VFVAVLVQLAPLFQSVLTLPLNVYLAAKAGEGAAKKRLAAQLREIPASSRRVARIRKNERPTLRLVA